MPPQQDWFEENAPSSAPPPAGGDWFEANAPGAAPAAPKPLERGIVARIWDWVNRGGVSPETVGKLPSPGTGLGPEQQDKQGKPFRAPAVGPERMPEGMNVNEEITEWEKRRDIAIRGGNEEAAARYDQLANNLRGLRDTVSGFTSPLAVGTMGVGPLLKAIKAPAALQVGAGFVPSVAFTAQGVEEATRPQEVGETEADVLQRRLGGAATTLIGVRGMEATIPAAAEVTEGALRKAFNWADARAAAGPHKAAYRGYQDLLQAAPAGRKPDYPKHVERLAGRGHLNQWANEYKPQDMRSGDVSWRKYMNDWETSTIDPAIERHPEGKIYGDIIAEDIRKVGVGRGVSEVFPELKAHAEEVAKRFAGRELTLKEGKEALKILNDMTEPIQKLAPENEAAAANRNSTLAALDRATDSVRNELYGTLEQLGEKGMAEARKDYGAMVELRNVLTRNVSKAELAEAKKPGYRDIPMRSVQKHELLAPGLLAGIASGYVNPISFAALPAVEAVRVYQERGSTPNAFFKSAVENFAKGPERAPLPAPRPMETEVSSEVLPRQPAALPPTPEGTPRPPTGSTDPVVQEFLQWKENFAREMGSPPTRRDIEAYNETHSLRSPERAPVVAPPSPLAPAAGSEPTPTGGARGFSSAPQPPEAVLPWERPAYYPVTGKTPTERVTPPAEKVEPRVMLGRDVETGKIKRFYTEGRKGEPPPKVGAGIPQPEGIPKPVTAKWTGPEQFARGKAGATTAKERITPWRLKNIIRELVRGEEGTFKPGSIPKALRDAIATDDPAEIEVRGNWLAAELNRHQQREFDRDLGARLAVTGKLTLDEWKKHVRAVLKEEEGGRYSRPNVGKTIENRLARAFPSKTVEELTPAKSSGWLLADGRFLEIGEAHHPDVAYQYSGAEGVRLRAALQAGDLQTPINDFMNKSGAVRVNFRGRSLFVQFDPGHPPTPAQQDFIASLARRGVNGVYIETGGRTFSSDFPARETPKALKEAAHYGLVQQAQRVVDLHNASGPGGGSTFHWTKGDLNNTPNFAVGGIPERRVYVKGRELNAEDVAKLVEQNEDYLLHKDNYAIGTWEDRSAGVTELNVTRIYDNREKALRHAFQRGEESIWDLKAHKEIKTNDYIPTVEEFANMARVGYRVANWYRRFPLFKEFFGDDLPRFAGITAALSPETPVKTNARQAFDVYRELRDWQTDHPGSKPDYLLVKGILENNGVLHVKNKIPNILRSWAGEPLSGPKVEPFRRNLLGDYWAMAIDSWVYRSGRVEFSPTKSGGHYKEATSNANQIKNRIERAAAGMGWTPDQVQAAVWGFTKTLWETTVGGKIKMGKAAAALKPEEISAASRDFHELVLNDPEVQSAARRAGFTDEHFESLRSRGESPDYSPPAPQEASPRVLRGVGRKSEAYRRAQQQEVESPVPLSSLAMEAP